VTFAMPLKIVKMPLKNWLKKQTWFLLLAHQIVQIPTGFVKSLKNWEKRPI
jgi:hypothetical protein